MADEVRLIDANALHKEITSFDHSVIYKDWVQSAIASAPTISDVAPVVRCKECEFHTFLGKCKVHSQEPDQYGPGHDVTMAPDDFCSYGKRKQLEE